MSVQSGRNWPCFPRRWGWGLAGVLTVALAGPVGDVEAQDDGAAVESLADLQRACRDAESSEPRRLYAMVFPAGSWRFGEYDAREGLLPIDTRRNLRAFSGAAELFPAHREPLGFRGSAERAAELRRAAGDNSLRVGFFLGFDNPNPTLCLIRPAAGVTTVRMDLAFAELTDADGAVVARDDTERLRSWRDDDELDNIPGEGPRGEARPPTLTELGRRAPLPWLRAFQRANRAALGRELSRCHAAGIERGARPSGQVVVRLRVHPSTGRVDGRRVELSSLRDEQAGRCIADAVAAVALPPSPSTPRSADGTTRLSVPVRLRN